VAGEATRRDHADPPVNAVLAAGGRALLEVVPQPHDLRLGRRAVEHAQIEVGSDLPGEVERRQAPGHLLDTGRVEPWFQQDAAERVHVVAGCTSAKQPCLQEGGPPAHEGVVHQVARLREAFDEEPGEVGLEARAVGHLVQRVAGALSGGPELPDVARQDEPLAEDILDTRRDRASRAAGGGKHHRPELPVGAGPSRCRRVVWHVVA